MYRGHKEKNSDRLFMDKKGHRVIRNPGAYKVL